MQDSASKTHLLLLCPRPFDPTTPIPVEPPSEFANYGSAFHSALEATIKCKSLDGIAAKWNVADEKALLHHVGAAHEKLRAWLGGTNVWGRKFKIAHTEIPFASRIESTEPLRVVSRRCAFDPDTHHYDLREGEFGGTADLVAQAAGNNFRVVLDYKSGWGDDWWGGSYASPGGLPQMLTLALQHAANAVAIMHAPRDGVISIYADEVTKKELTAFAKRRWSAARKIGSGFLRPGDHCAKCPASEGCPAQDSQMLSRAAALVKVALGHGGLATPVNKGAFHMFLGELSKLESRARAVLKAEVAAGEIITRPDGKVLIIREKTVEHLSKSSVVAALGAAKGEKMIAKLRELGCVTSDTREELHAVDETRGT